MVAGGIVSHGDDLDPSRRHMSNECVGLVCLGLQNGRNVAEHGPANLNSHPMARRMPGMAKYVKV